MSAQAECLEPLCKPETWTDVATIVAGASAAIQTAVVLVAAIYGFGQWRESRKMRSATIAFYLFDRLNSEAASYRRHQLYNEVVDRIDAPTESDLRVLSQIANDFHVTGFLLTRNLVDPELVLGLYYGTISRCWSVMEPWVVRERAKRGTAYAEYFEALALMAENYLSEVRPAEVPLVSRWKP